MQNKTLKETLAFLGVTDADLNRYVQHMKDYISTKLDKGTNSGDITITQKMAWLKDDYVNISYYSEPREYQVESFKKFMGKEDEIAFHWDGVLSAVKDQCWTQAKKLAHEDFKAVTTPEFLAHEKRKDDWGFVFRRLFDTEARRHWGKKGELHVNLVEPEYASLDYHTNGETDWEYTREYDEDGYMRHVRKEGNQAVFTFNIDKDMDPLIGIDNKKRKRLVVTKRALTESEIKEGLSKQLVKDYQELSQDPDFPIELFEVETFHVKRGIGALEYICFDGVLSENYEIKTMYLAYCNGMEEPMVGDSIKQAFATTKRRIKAEVSAKLMAAMEAL